MTSTPDQWMSAFVRMLWRLSLYVLFIAGGIYVLGRLKIVLISLVISMTIAYVMRPLAGWMARKSLGVPRSWKMQKRRALTTFYVLVVFFAGGYYSARFLVNPFVQEVRNVSDNWDSYQAMFEKRSHSFMEWYNTKISPNVRASVQKGLEQVQGEALSGVGLAVRQVGEAAHYIVEFVLLPVLAFYFALDSKRLKHEFVGALPKSARKEVMRTIHEFNQIMYSFVVGQAILCAIAGIFVGVGLALLQVKYALTMGVLAGLTRAIPIIGPILGGIPIILLTFVTRGMGVAVGVLIFFTLLHFAESKFVMPMLIGERMQLHPVVIIVVLLIGQEFGGLLGMFFAAPIAALLRVVIRRYLLKNHRRIVSHAH